MTFYEYSTPVDIYLVSRLITQSTSSPHSLYDTHTAFDSTTPYYHPPKYDTHYVYDDHTAYPAFPSIQILYDPVDKTKWIHQPNLVKWRHRYNGVRESLKINQEIGQYYYDIRILDTRHNSINKLLKILLDDLENGVSFQQLQSNWGQSPYTAYIPIVVTGIKDNTITLQRLKQRIRNLEA